MVAEVPFVDVVNTMLDESLPPDTASARSATEIIERMKELAQNLGSAFGRLIDEVMIPTVEITMRVLDQAGVVEFPLRINGREVKVTPVAPLAMAQHMDEVESIINYQQVMQLQQCWMQMEERYYLELGRQLMNVAQHNMNLFGTRTI